MSNVRAKKRSGRNATKIQVICFALGWIEIFIAFAYKNLDTFYPGLK